MICPVFEQVIKMDGAFYNVDWSNCTSSCDEVNLTWDWMAGMNGTGTPKVKRKDISITMNGTLEIHNVQLSDAGRYMCTVNRIGYRSPRVYFTALIVKGTNWLSSLSILEFEARIVIIVIPVNQL